MIRPSMEEKRFMAVAYQPETGIIEVLLTAAEAGAFDTSAYDYVLATARGTYAYRTANGTLIEKTLRGSGLGETALDIIRALQVNPGIVQTTADIADLIGNEAYYGGYPLPARMRVIRLAHDESGANQRLFCSGPDGGYYWPRDMTWCWIERIPPAAAPKKDEQ